MDRLSELLGKAFLFGYTCWDRTVLYGYIERLQRPEYLVYFFHNVAGIARIALAVLERAGVRFRKADNAFVGVVELATDVVFKRSSLPHWPNRASSDRTASLASSCMTTASSACWTP